MLTLSALYAVAAWTTITGLPQVPLDASHRRLINTLEAQGVSVRIEPKMVAEPCLLHLGTYTPAQKRVVVCQDPQGFTESSLNVLRHEAIHVIQDCRAGGLGGVMKAAAPLKQSYKQGQDHGLNMGAEFAPYVGMGASREVLELESEAISLSHIQTADQIADEVSRVCS